MMAGPGRWTWGMMVILLGALTRQAVAQAQKEVQDTVKLPEIVTYGSPRELAEAKADAARQPGSVIVIGPEVIRSSRQANLKDALGLVPGLYIAPRQGAADEAQISIRGSGLRNNYHSRGVNILINGMPYRNSDGFGEFEGIEMMSAEAIIVHKGGNAFRFGGATLGGAIDVKTRTGYTAKSWEVIGQGGAHGFYKGQLSSGGVVGRLDWYGAYAKTSLEGWRDHNEQGRDRINAHLGYLLSPTTDLRLFYLFAHIDEHYPGPLTPEEAAANPRAAAPGYVDLRYGRQEQLHHLGFQLRSQLHPGVRLEISPYYQYRDLDHPIFNVLNQQSNDLGAEVRLEAVSGAEGQNRLTVGLLPSRLRQTNRRFENVAGAHGALTKDQSDAADGLAFYLEASRRVGKVTAIAGLRREHQRRATTDHFLSNGDQSGDLSFEAWLPRLGVVADLSPRFQLYANLSRSYEPPLIAELNSLTVNGFIDLEAAAAWQYEVGTRGQRGGLRWDIALYRADLTNEILNQNVLPFPNAGFTVPTYRNAKRTRHSGIEAGLTYARPVQLFAAGDLLAIEAAVTTNRFRYLHDERYGSNDVPGVPHGVVSGAIRYIHPSGVSIGPRIEYVPGSYFVDSPNTTANHGWTTLGVRAEVPLVASGLTLYASAENLTNARYSPSVQIDAATTRFYEPADPRSFFVGFRWGR